MKTGLYPHLLSAALLFSAPVLSAQEFFEITSYYTGTGGNGTGTLGDNTFTFYTQNGGRVGSGTSSDGSSDAWLNSALTGPDDAFSTVTFPNHSPHVYGSGDAIMFGAGSSTIGGGGAFLTINFAEPQSNLMVLVSHLDEDLSIYSEPSDFYTLAPGYEYLYEGNAYFYSWIYNPADPSTYDLGRATLVFENPVSSITFLRLGGMSDDMYIGLATSYTEIVPEPSGALLVALGGSLALLGRRRSR